MQSCVQNLGTESEKEKISIQVSKRIQDWHSKKANTQYNITIGK